MKRRSIETLVLLMMLLSSCYKDIEDLSKIKGVTTNPTMAAPVINAETNLGKVVGDLSKTIIIETQPDKKLVLVFNSKDSIDEKQYFTLPDIDFNLNVPMPPTDTTAFKNTGKYHQELQTNIPITLTGNQRAERVLVSQGSVSLTVGSSFKHNAVIKVEYPGVTKNGKALTDSFVFIYNGVTPPPITRQYPLAGYEVDLTDNGSTWNVFTYKLSVDLIRINNNPVDLSDNISFAQQLNVDRYSRVEGYFGKFDITNFKQTNLLDIFDKKLDGNVFIKDPKLRLTVINSFGLPITAKITDIYVVSGGGNKVPIQIDQFKDTFTLNYTTNIGQTATTDYLIDRTNSNIDDVLSSAPQEIVYEVSFTANSQDIVSSNVLYDYTTVKQYSRLELPFDLRILHYTVEASGGLKLNQFKEDLEKEGATLNWGEGVSELTNEMPLNAYVQVYFDDSLTNTLIDSAFAQEYFLPAAQIDASGNVITPSKATQTNYMDAARYNRISTANRYRMQVRLRTAEENSNLPFVSFYDYQKLRLKMGFRANVTYTSK